MDKQKDTALNRIKSKLVRIGMLNFFCGVLAGVLAWLIWTKVIPLPSELPEAFRLAFAVYLAFAAVAGIIFQPILIAFYSNRANEARELLKKGRQKDWRMKDMPMLGCSLVAVGRKQPGDGKVEEDSYRLLLCVPANVPMFGKISIQGKPTNDRETEIVLNSKQDPILLIEEDDLSLVLFKYPLAFRSVIGPEWRF